MLSNIKIRSFTGGGIKPYIPTIVKLRKEVLEIGNLEAEIQNLKKLSQCKETIAILVFDGPKIVGASIGFPLEDEPSSIRTFFTKARLNPVDYFYFGESVLQKPYRGRGLGHHLFDLREAHVKHLKRFKYICFCSN